MNLAIVIALFVIFGLKILHSTDANDDTFDRNARKLLLPYKRRMQLYRRRMNARRGYFRDTTQTQFQSYDSWGAGGQLDLLQEEYGEGRDREEYELPQGLLEYQKALRAQIHMEGYNAAENVTVRCKKYALQHKCPKAVYRREYQVNKLLMKSRGYKDKAKDEDLFEAYKYMGDWVYGRNVSIRPSDVFGQSTTTRIPAYYNDRSCLRPCPLIYRFDYGMICAIRWHRPKPTGLHQVNEWFESHSGTSQYPTYFLRNFTNLCEMEVINCIMLHLDTDIIYSWKVMFRGPCPSGMDDEEAMMQQKGPPGNPLPLTDPEKEVVLVDQWVNVIEKKREKVNKASKDTLGNFLETLNKSRTVATTATST